MLILVLLQTQFLDIKDYQILNSDGLRNNKEFVNHKILDCIGDLYTAGYRIIASVQCSKGGHYLTNQLLRKVFSNKDNFSIIEIHCFILIYSKPLIITAASSIASGLS